eukprot:TRINITY_DN1757_c0_g1_i8.p1 TRINITY_DN1757_c0_g1~~TRINITY_DN1757_c0_g1_i8.p1  ORF type:complete len:675 (-),score=103.14 TRINITY_DN1757_c0_g1_i8:762-2786(-)
MAQSGFTRDILKWLQGLDLSYSVKNPRRDFANGFIVAEIFSRYYPADVQMHSYDNGTSLQKKLDNWALLDRFIKKREIPLNPSLVEDTMHAKPGAAISLVESIYEFLTKKSIAKSGQGNTETTSDRTDLPSYAKPTASKAIKEGISSAELFLKPDLQYPANKASSIIDQHEKAKKEEKRHERIGYASKLNSRDFVSSDAGSVINKTQFQTVAPPIAAGGVQFREVKVRPVERTISQVRANRGNSSELASKVPSRPSSRASSAGGSVTVKQEVSSSKPGGNISGTFTILNTVGSIILNTLQGTQLKLELEKHHNVCELFVARSQSLPEHVLVNAINSLSDNTQLICSVIADNFHELPVLLTTFLPLFNLPEGYGRMFEKMGEVYIQWGSFLASGNRSFEAWQIFYIQILPRLTSVIRLHLSSRHIFLRAILSFCPSDAEHHIECINQLQLCLQDYDVFYLCLAKLALYDSVMSSPNLLNAYATHALAAIGTNSPNSKSAGLAILVLIAHQDYRFVVGMFDRLSALAQDPWWEIQSQVLIIGTKLLRGVNSGSAQCYKIYSVLHSILNDECSPLVQKIGLIYLTPILEFHPDLYKIYLLTLIMAPEHLRQELLQDDPALVSDIQVRLFLRGSLPCDGCFLLILYCLFVLSVIYNHIHFYFKVSVLDSDSLVSFVQR